MYLALVRPHFDYAVQFWLLYYRMNLEHYLVEYDMHEEEKRLIESITAISMGRGVVQKAGGGGGGAGRGQSTFNTENF